MANILVTGSNGQLGREIAELTKKRASSDCYYFTDAAELDITDALAVETFVEKNSIDLIINCAAYNKVGEAEKQMDTAVKVNVTGPANLAASAFKHNIYLIHFSTDYVFNGEARTPYHEADRTCPINAYGRTKYAGEVAVKKSGCMSIIIRTSWLYSPLTQDNFVRKMIGFSDYYEEIKVVCDQIGTPTYAADLAEALLKIIPQLSKENPIYAEVFHYSNEGKCSWADFAEKIMSTLKIDCDIIRVTSEEYADSVRRPAYSVLDKTLIKKRFGVAVPSWERSLSKAARLFKR